MNSEEPEISVLPRTILIGLSIDLALSDNEVKTLSLWQEFMPKRKRVTNCLDNNLWSVQIFDKASLNFCDSNRIFQKWAAIRVTNTNDVPEGLKSYTIEGGLYAVFVHRGTASRFMEKLSYIVNTWLPHSEYLWDNREQFEIMKSDYNPNNPSAVEEVWIPIKMKP